MRRIILLVIATLMVAAMAASPTFAAPPSQVPCPPCPVEANDEAQGNFFTASGTVLGDPPNPNSLHAENGIDTAFMSNVNP